MYLTEYTLLLRYKAQLFKVPWQKEICSFRKISTT